ncbi:hypothetical protein KC734_14975 [candidate division KSB1 bacterium]|nr:hypothetical protein [candidate division KSB1 bacterium]
MLKIAHVMNLAGALFLILLFCATTAFSQEKKKPEKPQAPPTRIKIPADSTKADSAQAKAGKAALPQNDERLQLPDVLIYGSGGEKRTAGKKITISPDQPELVNPPSLYNPLQTEDVEAGERQQLLQTGAKSKFRQFELAAFGGQYDLYGGNGKYWQSLAAFNFGIEADYSHLGGQFENSQDKRFSLGMRLGLTPSPGNNWRLSAQHVSADYGLYGSAVAGHTRETLATAAEFAGDFELSEVVRSSITAEFGKGDLRNAADAASAGLFDVENTYYAATGEVGAHFANSELKLQARTLGDQLDAAGNDSAEVKWHALNFSYNFALSGKVSAELSADYTAVSVDGAATQTRLRPGARMFLAPSRKLVITASFSSGFTYMPWQNALAANRYIANGTRPLPEDNKWRVTANVDWQVSRNFVFKAKYENQRIDGLNYFLRDSLGTFALHRDDFRMGLASVGGQLIFSETMKLDFSLNLFEDALRLNGQDFNNLYDVPYRGEFRAPVTLTLAPRKNLSFETQFAWVGKRRTALLQVAEAAGEVPRFQELSAYLFSTIHMNWQAAQHVEIFAQANNLVDDGFDAWQGYPEMGLNALLGARYIW